MPSNILDEAPRTIFDRTIQIARGKKHLLHLDDRDSSAAANDKFCLLADLHW
jgi:hypothetical protein